MPQETHYRFEKPWPAFKGVRGKAFWMEAGVYKAPETPTLSITEDEYRLLLETGNADIWAVDFPSFKMRQRVEAETVKPVELVRTNIAALMNEYRELRRAQGKKA